MPWDCQLHAYWPVVFTVWSQQQFEVSLCEVASNQQMYCVAWLAYTLHGMVSHEQVCLQVEAQPDQKGDPAKQALE